MHFNLKYIFAAAISLLLSSVASSQSDLSKSTGSFEQVAELSERAYGLDQQLVNGVFFEDVYRGAKGHPYLFEDLFVMGSVVFRNKPYEKVLMKYDLYAQQLLISHPHEGFQMTSILTDDFVSSFEIYGMDFRKLSFSEGSPTYYQVISEKELLSCYVQWVKVRNETINENDSRQYLFAGEKRRLYLYMDGEIQRFLNNATFSRVFTGDARRLVKRYMRTNKLKINKATDEELRQLIDECNSIVLTTKVGIE